MKEIILATVFGLVVFIAVYMLLKKRELEARLRNSMHQMHAERDRALVAEDQLRQERVLRQQAEESAKRDPMTGLANRGELTSQLSALASPLLRRDSEEKRAGLMQSLAAAMIDADFFKAVNDTYGHDVGDQVLIDIARVLRSVVRDTDLVARYGGEEFVVVFPNISAEKLAEVAEEIRAAIEDHEFVNDLLVTVSVGTAHTRFATTPEKLLKEADLALYDAKKDGRNRVVGRVLT